MLTSQLGLLRRHGRILVRLSRTLLFPALSAIFFRRQSLRAKSHSEVALLSTSCFSNGPCAIQKISIVQITAEPIGPTIDAIRNALSWLGKCKREQAGHSTHLVFRFAPEAEPGTSLKLKVEINTREHTSLFGAQGYPFKVENGWFNGAADIISVLTRATFLGGRWNWLYIVPRAE
ncbi:hypothetical protein FHX09_005374 [Rhizobium sp. BK538]|nr:hypothetical protein [Rhizobium sp. BK060]MBB4171480.1 hypothetical protein [Rhizobium sp. BK538]TCM68253.1 hypothetical protein EV291_13024 [Rhizobium sp. BK068]